MVRLRRRSEPLPIDYGELLDHVLVESFNNRLQAMATVNFSVPDEVKAAFDRVFGDQNKSAIIADLMRKAIAEAGLRQRRQEIIRGLTERRAARPARSAAETRAARRAGRP